VSGVIAPRQAAILTLERAARGEKVAFVFGNEKTGLAQDDVDACDRRIRIPMAADQPSVNLAQSVQLMAYELFLAGLTARNAEDKDE
jgi:tRNA (cytidine32/uridine32-2'-O)-methyltransferase